MALDYIEERNGGYYVRGTRVSLDSVVRCFTDGLSPEELPVLALATAEKRPPPAVPPIRRTVPWTDGGADADDLAAAARAAIAR